MTKSTTQKKIALIVSVVIILLFTGSLLAIYFMNLNDNSFTYANIYQNNRLIKTINLSEVTEPYTFTVYYDDDDYNVIQVRNGSIGIIEASCPDGLCKNMGFISGSSLPITCLPNHLVIELSDESGGQYDGIAY